MASIEVTLTKKDLAIAVEDYVRTHLKMIPVAGTAKFDIDQGDPCHFADTGPIVSAKIQAILQA